jgi:hypothetical protein
MKTNNENKRIFRCSNVSTGQKVWVKAHKATDIKGFKVLGHYKTHPKAELTFEKPHLKNISWFEF